MIYYGIILDERILLHMNAEVWLWSDDTLDFCLTQIADKESVIYKRQSLVVVGDAPLSWAGPCHVPHAAVRPGAAGARPPASAKSAHTMEQVSIRNIYHDSTVNIKDRLFNKTLVDISIYNNNISLNFKEIYMKSSEEADGYIKMIY